MKTKHIPAPVQSLLQLSGSVRFANDAQVEDGTFECLLDNLCLLAIPKPKKGKGRPDIQAVELDDLEALEAWAKRVKKLGSGVSLEVDGETGTLNLQWSGEGEGTLQIAVNPQWVMMTWTVPAWGKIHRGLLLELAEADTQLEVVEG